MFEKFSWISWSLQILFGAFVGLIIGIALSIRGGLLRNHLPSAYAFILSVSTIISGFVGKYGDRLWVGRTSLDEPRVYNNHLSSVINHSMIISGSFGALIAFVINIQN